ncbi:MAG: T9SS type A sorting domain-containing protein [bacterium]|nr:T9SS type A sorting domain-containing protein [bacterium]
MIAHIRFSKLLMVTFSMLLFSTIAGAQYQQNQLRYPGDSLGLTIRGGSNLAWTRQISTGSDGISYIAWGEYGDYDYRVRGAAFDSLGNHLWTRTINNCIGDQDDPVVLAVPGGCIVAWIDYRDDVLGGAVYAQKLSPTGITQWHSLGDTIVGVRIAATPEQQLNIKMISDGGDGAILVWEDQRRGLSYDLWGTRILGNGQTAPGFRANGTPIAVAAASQPYNSDYSICTDGRGGAWVTWVDNRQSGDPDIYFQRLRANGTLLVDSTGFQLIGATGEQAKIRTVEDGRGGAFLVWYNNISLEENSELYMQRIDSSGTPRWNPGVAGVPLINVAGCQTNPRIIASGIDTCIVAWEDFRTDPAANSNEDIYINRVTGANTLVKLWGETGLPVCVNSYHQREMRMISDGSRGAVLFWEDERNYSSPEQDFFAQRVNSNGEIGWGENGIPVAFGFGGQRQPMGSMVRQRVFFAWEDSRNGSLPIYRTMLNSSGSPANNFPIGGIETVPDISWNCYDISILSNEPGRFITSWVDQRRMPLGSRVYYSVNNAITGAPIGCALNGNPITLDTTNRVSQSGGWDENPPILVATPDLGAISVFIKRNGDDQYIRYIWGQKISRNGERMWGNFGSQISSSHINPNNLCGVPDGNSGALICFTTVDTTTPFYYNRVRVQHILYNGEPQLHPDGLVIDSADCEQSFSYITKSGGNYYLGYLELYDEINFFYSVKVAKIDLYGQVLWRRTIADSARNTSNGNRQHLRLTPASDGGVVAYWQEYCTDSNDGGQIFAQRLNSNGIAQWDNGGIRVGFGTEDQSASRAVQSGNNFWFVWRDVRNGGNAQAYLQRVSEDGSLANPSGIQIYPSSNYQTDPNICAGSNGSVFVSWRQYGIRADSGATTNTLAKHFNANLQNADPVTWNQPNGIGVVTRYFSGENTLVSDGMGGALIGINRFRLHKEENLVVSVQRIYDRACVDVQEQVSEALPNEYTLEQNFPNPFNGETKFRFTLPVSGVVKVTIFDVMGREVVTAIHRQLQAGTFDVRWNGKSNTGMKVGSGVYFYRIEAGIFVSTKKMVMVQ